MVYHLPGKRVEVAHCCSRQSHTLQKSGHTHGSTERTNPDEGMESEATSVPNKSCVELGHVSARLHRRRSTLRTAHTPASGTALVGKHALTGYVLTVSWHRLVTESNSRRYRVSSLRTIQAREGEAKVSFKEDRIPFGVSRWSAG